MMRYCLMGIAIVGTLATMSFVLPHMNALTYTAEGTEGIIATTTQFGTTNSAPLLDTRPMITHVPLPVPLRAIYMTSCVVGTPSFRDRLVKILETTELNAIVIDIKDFSGTISFPPLHDNLKGAWKNTRCGAKDMHSFVALLHKKDIYVIGRITVFQDSYYTALHPELAVKKADGVTIWKDRKGLSFIDVGSKPYWDYIVDLSADAYNIGFDELNFDYVRYPSDGDMVNIVFPNSYASLYGHDKQANLEAFFTYLNDQLDNEKLFDAVRHEHTGRASSTPWTSVDLFGMTTTNTDDLSIGQIIERVAAHFDFVAPMVYPSHYPNGFMGFDNPNKYPYKVVNATMGSAVKRMEATTTVVAGFAHTRIGTSTPARYAKPVYTAEKLRTWIQDFNYGGIYDGPVVRSEVQASYDAGVHSFMIWSPSNEYHVDALKPKNGE